MKNFVRRLDGAGRDALVGVVHHVSHGTAFDSVEILARGVALWTLFGCAFYTLPTLQKLWLEHRLCEPRHLDPRRDDGYWDYELPTKSRRQRLVFPQVPTRKVVFYISLGYLDSWECVTHAHRVALRFGFEQEAVETLKRPFFDNL